MLQLNVQLMPKEIRSGETFMPDVIEFRVFIHKHPGYLNSYILKGGRPHLVIPGQNKVLNAQLPQIFYYSIK